MIALYYCWEECAPVMRYEGAAPCVGDTVALPEFGGNRNPLKVVDVVLNTWDEPSISVYLRQVPAVSVTAN